VRIFIDAIPAARFAGAQGLTNKGKSPFAAGTLNSFARPVNRAAWGYLTQPA
jgi:hypothetical protein